MKMIMALIRNDRVRHVQEALLKTGIKGFTMSGTLGMGELRNVEPTGVENLVQHVRVEIALPDAWVETAIHVLRKSAETGHAGDGVIFVYPLERAIKIRNGKENEQVLIPDFQPPVPS